MSKYDDLINKVEGFYEEGKAKKAEAYLTGELDTARKENDAPYRLLILNELIGYYRQTSEREKLINIIEETIEVSVNMDVDENKTARISYATSVLNAANGYRSINELEEAEELYNIVEGIYIKELDEKDPLFSGLYNNMSLMYQEKSDYKTAEKCLLKALFTVDEDKMVFETAVIYSNLALTRVMIDNKDGQSEFETTKNYANKAIELFTKINTFDNHYTAAIIAFAMCDYYKGNYEKAAETFKKGMDIIENLFGKNAEYMRLLDNYNACNKKIKRDSEDNDEDNNNEENESESALTGLELSELYYEKVGKKVLEEKFPTYIDRLAIGLVGEGSDCFGFDDEASRDHDWGPGFCIWVTDEVYNEIGDKLIEVYNSLPDEFMGYKRIVTKTGANRHGVIKISDFIKKYTGVKEVPSPEELMGKINWAEAPDYSLAAAVNGKVFCDKEGIFSRYRAELKKGYPENVLYLKLADDFAKISQTGQYNFFRMIERGDRVTADMMLSDCIKQIMTLAYHIRNVYPPHEKWLYKGMKSLDNNLYTGVIVNSLHECFALKDDKAVTNVKYNMDQFCGYIAKEAYDKNYISDIDSYLDLHTDELVRKSSYSMLSDDELINKIVKTEFKAFDKVENEGGRASCQNNYPTFYVMRKSQYLTWNRSMLIQYLYDFEREFEIGHNLITEKYGRMMESTAPEKYAEIKDKFPEISEEKKKIIEQIVSIQVEMFDEFGKAHPKLSENTRDFHSYEDGSYNTSSETYLRGEISTYSDKMLQLYGAFVINCVKNGINITTETITNTAKLYGFESLEQFEKSDN